MRGLYSIKRRVKTYGNIHYRRYSGKVHIIRKNIIHLMRGQVFTIEGKRFFTFGGAQSHDIDAGILDRNGPDFSAKRKKLDRDRALYRIDHESWWKEELPSEDEMNEGLKNLEKVDNNVLVLPLSVANDIKTGVLKFKNIIGNSFTVAFDPFLFFKIFEYFLYGSRMLFVGIT